MCQIDFVTSFYFHSKLLQYAQPSELVAPVPARDQLSVSQQLSISSSSILSLPIPSPLFPSQPILSHPILSTSMCTGSAAAWARGTCLSFLSPPPRAAHFSFRQNDSYLQTETTQTAKRCQPCQHQLVLSLSTGTPVKLFIDSSHATSSLFSPLGGQGM